MNERRCKQCGGVMAPRPGESSNFLKREFCSPSCRSQWFAAHRPAPPPNPRHERIREVLAKDPDLEGWQIAERFGLSRGDACELRMEVRRQLRRERHRAGTKQAC